jgi:hypothetical protein
VQSPAIPEWLRAATYDDLFLGGGAERVLARPGVVEELKAAMRAENVPPTIRVLAHELLREFGEAPDPTLAEAYCQALPEGFAHNAWGMPGQYAERLGETVVRMGDAAVPCLAALLEDRRRLGYFGSEEPTLSDQMEYRVRDLAADLLARIRGEAFPGDQPPSARNGEIRRLRDLLDPAKP